MSLHMQYARPRKLDQALGLLEGLGAGAMVIAGGQELMPFINYGKLMPAVLVDIGALGELGGIREENGWLSIGALTVHRDLQQHPLVRERAPLLAEGAAQVGGGWQVHNRGTIGGNIVAMHPLYDIVPPLLVLGAEVEICGASGARRVPLAKLMAETNHGLGVTAVLTRVLVPAMPEGAGHAYRKLKIVDGSYGSANAAALVALDERRALRTLRVAVGAASERPLDVSDGLQKLLGRSADARLLAEIEALCAAAIAQPLSDQRGEAAYRRAMAGVMARRAVAAALENVQ